MEKKILILTILFFGYSLSYGQNYLKDWENYWVGGTIDPNLLLNGAYEYDTTPVLDLSIRAGTRLKNNVEITLSVEFAKLKPSYFATKIGLNYVFEHNIIDNLFFDGKSRIHLSAGLDMQQIVRSGLADLNGKQLGEVYAHGVNFETRLFPIKNKSFRLGLILSLVNRRDLYKAYGDEVFYKVNGSIEMAIEIKRWKRKRY